MRIQHNISALNAHRQLGGNNTAVSKNLEKLSSGYKINKAGDDAAGLAISEKMRAQIRGLETASKNAQDGISLVQTAEGALTEVHSMLNRMVELATQSANGVYDNDTDRKNLQSELNTLRSEIDRIGNSTNFNGIKLLDGSIGKGDVKAATTFDIGKTLATSLTITDIQGSNFSEGTYALSAGYVDADGKFTAATTGDSIQVAFTDAKTGDVKNTVLKVDDIFSGKIAATIDDVTDTLAAGDVGTLDLSSVGIGKISFAMSGSVSVGGIAGAIGGAIGTTTVGTPTGNGSLRLQVGDTAEQFVDVNVKDMRAAALNLNTLNIGNQEDAKDAIDVIKSAINNVSATRGDLGALQNRLEHTVNNLGVTAENMTAAESRIRDVDMAKEMMDFTKNNILTQAAQAMLAQANQLPQGVLQLLR